MALILMEMPIKISEHPACRPRRHCPGAVNPDTSSWGAGGKRPAPKKTHQPAGPGPQVTETPSGKGRLGRLDGRKPAAGAPAPKQVQSC